MSEEFWLDVISRITPDEPIELDSLVFETEPNEVSNLDSNAGDNSVTPSNSLWDSADSGSSYIGIKVTERLADCSLAAFKLAAAALERGVTPIILTTLPDSGFERFGFRVERLVGNSPKEYSVHEQQLVQFWNLAIVIDVAQVAALN